MTDFVKSNPKIRTNYLSSKLTRECLYSAKATFIIDEKLSVRYSNTSGLALAREEIGLCKRFVTDDKIFRARLQSWLSRYRTGVGSEGTRLPLAMISGRKVMVDAIHLGDFGLDLILLTVDDPYTMIKRNLSGVCRAFCLTAAEARVLEMIVEGLDTVLAAKRLGIAPTTARTHLQSIFSKTGTFKQSDLVRFVATYAH
jgi:DNA-binding CsgD family transcriptional regulator